MKSFFRFAPLTLAALALTTIAEAQNAKPQLPKEKLSDQLGVPDAPTQDGQAPSEVKTPLEVESAGAPPAANAAPLSATNGTPAVAIKKKPTAKKVAQSAPTPAPTATPTATKLVDYSHENSATSSSEANAAAGPTTGNEASSDAHTSLLGTSSSSFSNAGVSSADAHAEASTEGAGGPAANVVITTTSAERAGWGTPDEGHADAPPANPGAIHNEYREARTTWNPAPTFFLATGYTYSKWRDFSGALKNGSFDLGLGFSREFRPGLEGLFSFNYLTASSSSEVENANGAWTIDLGTRWMPFEALDAIRPYFGLALSVGGYKVWSVAAETPTTVTYHKDGAGSLIGLVPSLGVKIPFSPSFAFDIGATYRAYFDNPNYKVGGWGLQAGLNFSYDHHRHY